MVQPRLSFFFAASLFAIAGVSAWLASCQPTCDSIPTEALAQVRVLNAVSNADLLLIYVDGKLFDSAWYDVEGKYGPNFNPQHKFGYRSTYLSDGSSLRAGLHQVTAKARLIGQKLFTTVLDASYVLYGHRQSLIYIGKIHGSAPQAPRAVYTDDIVRPEDASGPSFARFIHAVPDVKGPLDTAGLDVYFASMPHLTNGVPDSGFRIRYAHISHQPAGDNGTGLSPEDYLQLPALVPGLVMMPIGDTNINDVIVNFPHQLPTNGLLVTIVIRGEKKPVGNEPATSAIVLEDGGAGTIPFSIQSFNVRIVNATPHEDSLSLLISNPNDQDPRIPRSTANTPYPTQQKVLDITEDSVSQYMGLGTLVPYYTFWFASSYNPSDTIFRFTTNALDTVYPRIPPLQTNVPYTFVALDTIPQNTGTPGIALLELLDTVANPANASEGRVRFVNASADYSAKFTFAGRSFSLKQGQVAYGDTLAGNYAISVNSRTVELPVQSASPITVFFMPATMSDPLPYRISMP